MVGTSIRSPDADDLDTASTPTVHQRQAAVQARSWLLRSLLRWRLEQRACSQTTKKLRATTEMPREQSPQRRAVHSRVAAQAREQLFRGDDVPALCLGDGLEQRGLQVGR